MDYWPELKCYILKDISMFNVLKTIKTFYHKQTSDFLRLLTGNKECNSCIDFFQ